MRQRAGAGARRGGLRARARRRGAAAPRVRARGHGARARARRRSPTRTRARCSTALLDARTRRSRTRATATSRTCASGRCEQRVGNAAGWLNAGRPRREAGRIAFRIALRDAAARPPRRGAAVRGGADRAGARASATRRCPTTPTCRPPSRRPPGTGCSRTPTPCCATRSGIERDFAAVNRSPAGTGGVNGSRFPLDRERLAQLLGFDGLIEHTRDANWQTDPFTEAVWHAATAATNASRFAEDVELYASDGVRPARDRRRVLPRERADAAEAQPVRARGHPRRGEHAARPRDRRARDAAHALRPHRQPALRLRGGRGRDRARHAHGRPRRGGRGEPARHAARRRRPRRIATDAAELLSLERASTTAPRTSRSGKAVAEGRFEPPERRRRSPRARCSAAPRPSRWTRCSTAHAQTVKAARASAPNARGRAIDDAEARAASDGAGSRSSVS